ncbi:MAG TPA: SDR family NAD(P)-dependent oxidoreductase, partial [Acidobacteriaceae bacterium]|nr:SDR family NAD(P)-dependent oxidoreductase [Acidobacteriaceae bacterium]
MPSQAGRRAIVTGANSGIGYYAALELAGKGAHVLLACRDRLRGDAALLRLRAAVPNASAEVAQLDLASLASVRAFAEDELKRGVPLDLLINNAGVMAPKKRLETKDGFELQF